MKALYKCYPSNLTDAQGQRLQPYLPAAKPGGRPRSINLRAVRDAIFYILCAGCAWRLLPSDFPPWQTVYSYFRTWRLEGTWQRIHRYLKEGVRRAKGKHNSPSAAIMDSQPVEIGVLSNQECGFDGGKLVKGRKRHILVDTLGLLIAVVVTAANVSDQAGARQLFTKVKSQRRGLNRLLLIWADSSYRGESFMQWVFDRYRWILEVVLRSDSKAGFVVIPKRWIVEQTFGWFF